jgi:predicted ATPase
MQRIAGVSLSVGFDELDEAKSVLRFVALLRAEALGHAGQVSEGLAAVDELIARSEHTEERWLIAGLLRIRGELLLLEGATEAAAAAEDHYRQGLDWARRQGALSWELRCATSLARWWHGQARRKEAHELLAAVYDRFTEGFATADLRAAKAQHTIAMASAIARSADRDGRPGATPSQVRGFASPSRPRR